MTLSQAQLDYGRAKVERLGLQDRVTLELKDYRQVEGQYDAIVLAAAGLAPGAILTATDYAPESLVMTRLTCRLHTGLEPATRQLNWRALDAHADTVQ